ncbi:MAG: DoxX family protein [Phycisphaerales bacterium]
MTNPTANADAAPCCQPGGCGCKAQPGSRRCALGALALLLRVALGGLLMFSGWVKLGIADFGVLPVLSPLDFAYSIKGFKMGLPDGLVEVMAFAIPWGEFIIGAFILLGLWTRAAAALSMIMMVSFTAGILSVIARGLDVNCPCFGAIKLFCSGAIGPCHVVRNSGFFLAGLFIALIGPGFLSLDGVCGARSCGTAARTKP